MASRNAAALALIASVSAVGADLLADRARRQIARRLEQLPNYVCEQVVERRRAAPGGATAVPDRLRLEIAYIGGREVLASPGTDALGQSREAELMQGGMAFSGLFASFLKTLVSSSVPAWRSLPEAEGKPRFACSIPRHQSDYLLGTGDPQAITGYHALITADASTLDILELEIRAEAAERGIAGATTRVRYAPRSIGGQPVIVPAQAEIEIRRTDGAVSHTAIRYENCRAYAAESKIDFAPSTKTDGSRPAAADLRAGLRMRVQLEEAIPLERVARGDLVRARLAHDLVVRDRVLAQAGTRITGRVEHVEVRHSPLRHALAVIVFRSLETANVPLTAEIDSVRGPARVRLLHLSPHRTTYTLTRGTLEFASETNLAGSRALLVEAPLDLPAGLELQLTVVKTSR